MDNKTVKELLEGRRTYRRFDEARDIPDEVVTVLTRVAARK